MKLLYIATFSILIGSCLSDSLNSTHTTRLDSTTASEKPTKASSIASTAAEPNPRANQTSENHKNENITSDLDNDIPDEGWEFENTSMVDTRRILYSKSVKPGKRPYMVYLSLTKESAKAHKYRGWLCAGVIVDPSYVLTSAACVEDADRFYIVAGTTKFVDSFDYKSDDCVCKHRRKVVWKCIPKNYKFDFQDSIKWSSNDIAIVKVDKPFKLGVTEKGCQFAADLICYNNISRELEKPGTKGYIAGWGSGSNFREGVYRRQNHKPENAKCLQEAKVCVMDNEACAKKWAQRFREIITQYMICTKDVMKRLSEICDKKYANCTDVETRRQLESESQDPPTEAYSLDLGRHLRDPDDYTARRASVQGGFCENDHGGPLIVKYQGKERVIGVISACKIDPKSHNCHGPFLYTSVFKNRQFISCAIHKDVEENCRRVFRTGITHEEYTVDWEGYEEDDAKRSDDKREKQSSSSSDDSDDDKVVLRQKTIESKEEEKITADSFSAEDTEKLKDIEDKKHKETKTENSKEETKKKHKSKKEKKTASKKEDVTKEEVEIHAKKEKRGAKDFLYESSKDENVNEPEE